MITQSLCEIKVDMRAPAARDRIALNTAGGEWKFYLFDSFEEYELLKHALEHLHFGACMSLMTAEIKAERFAVICSKFSRHPQSFPFIFFLARRV